MNLLIKNSSGKFTEEFKNKILEEYNDGLSTIKIGKKYNICTSSIWRLLKKNPNFKSRSNEINSKKYYYDENFFELIDTEEKAYWLGFLYADGYVSCRKYNHILGISLAEKDFHHLEKLNNSLKSNVPIATYITKNGYNPGTKYCRLIFCGKKIFNDAISQGIVEQKTNKLKPPQNIPEELYRHYIRGYMDGDGSITLSSTIMAYKIRLLGTYDILVDIENHLLSKINIHKVSKYYKRKSEQTVMQYEIGGNLQVRKVLDFLYEDATIYLDRKYDRYIDLCKMLDSRTTAKAVCDKSPELRRNLER